MTLLAKQWADDFPDTAITPVVSHSVQHCCTEEIEETKETEEIEETDVGESVWNELEAAIKACALLSNKTSNGLLFEFARRVRGIEKRNTLRLSPALLHKVFRYWRTENEGFLRPEHDYECEFLVKLNAVRHAWGEMLGSAVEVAYAEKPSTRVQHIKDHDAHVLANLCRELQRLAGAEAFYLDGRACAQLLARSHSTVANWLRALQTLRVIKLVEQGRQGRASRYCYIAED